MVGPLERAGRWHFCEAYLKPLIILMIGLLAGPDFFAAAELTTLLELLGATLFLLTFAIGFRVVGLAAFEWLRSLWLPIEYVALIKMRGKPSARFHGASLIFRNGLRVCCLGFLAYTWICELVRSLP